MNYNKGMSQSLSVKCKLIVPQELRQDVDATLSGFADACNQILKTAQEERCYNTTKLHHLTYYSVKAATGLKANHVCQAIRRVLGALEVKKNVKEFRPTSLNLDIRTFSYNEHDTFNILKTKFAMQPLTQNLYKPPR